MRVGIIGTGAVARKHARAYLNIGYQVTVCTNSHEETGRQFDPRVVEAFNQVIGCQKGVVHLETLPEIFDSLPIVIGAASSPDTKDKDSKRSEGKLC